MSYVNIEMVKTVEILSHERTSLYYTVNTMAADDQVMQGAKP